MFLRSSSCEAALQRKIENLRYIGNPMPNIAADPTKRSG